MKFKLKIYLLCMVIYIITLTATSLAVTENTHSNLTNSEIKRALQEERNMKDIAAVYLIANQKLSEDKLDIQDYSKRIVDMYGSDNIIVELYNKELKRLDASKNINWSFKRDDLDKLMKDGKNYVVRKQDGISYLFINDFIKGDSGELVLSYIKDISQVELQKNEQYKLFFITGIIGLIIIAAIVEGLSRILMRPIINLSSTAEKIASGNFSERAEIKGKDEISKLGIQFNKMAEEVENKIVELQSEGERKQRFIDNLTHELRTPLTSIIGYSELLQKIKYDETTYSKGLGYVHSEGVRMLKLVNSLMDMILLRKSSLNLENVNTISLLNEIVDLMHIKARDKSAKLLVKGESLQINMDRDMIKGGLLNLVDNAIKASYTGGKIIVGCEKIDSKCRIYVQDEGKGIAEGEISKLTEAFYRVDKSRARKDGGAGLGLAFCKQIVESHGGELVIESELEKGTRVSIVLPEYMKGEESDV
ncbi:HAMP domain-containing histidine kinase [Clostridium swellfunianum]|uniref:sensor histidine kinase n=1 Tax=Clostridium swellfunianum TaxID=1367462 RepID=UPI002030C33E|nr:HAMP domain-containing sensor histidine kinase [Clostridium swellfunianum]MCM0649701.1 HAMP domain-containing histidine kinase [Clostridium swellfunianum]